LPRVHPGPGPAAPAPGEVRAAVAGRRRHGRPADAGPSAGRPAGPGAGLRLRAVGGVPLLHRVPDGRGRPPVLGGLPARGEDPPPGRGDRPPAAGGADETRHQPGREPGPGPGRLPPDVASARRWCIAGSGSMASYSRPVVTTEHGVPAVAAAGGAPASRPAAAWRTRLGEAAFPLGVFAVVAVVLYAVAEIAITGWRPPIPGHGFPDYRGFEAFTRWDSDWYLRIARIGYYYDGPHKQSAVNFFPGYPAMIRLVRTVLRNYIVAGVVVTYLSGAAAVVLLHRWCSGAFGSRAAKMAVLLLALYPFAFYLFGTVYSDALFLAAALGAFVLLEADHPWLAGAVGALAVATRPAGPAVVIGLTIRALELRGVLGGAPGHFLRGG